MARAAWEHAQNIPGFGREAAAAPVQRSRRSGKGGVERSGTCRPSPASRAGADFGHTPTEARAGLLQRERDTASGGCVRPEAGLVRIDDLLMVLDGSPCRTRRRTFGPVPQLQVAQDLFNDRAVADQADDLERSGAAGTDQGIRFVHFLDQPGPGSSAAALQFNSRTLLVPRTVRAGLLEMAAQEPAAEIMTAVQVVSIDTTAPTVAVPRDKTAALYNPFERATSRCSRNVMLTVMQQ